MPVWEMEIEGIFRLGDGRTAFAGTGAGWTPLARRASCEILVDGEVVERVVVSTDLMDPGREGQWAFSSMDEVKLDEATVLERRCVLRLATDG
jgi:hypothetical protein